MKNLWTILPPLLSDNFGMVEVLKNSDGCGVIDDSGEFRMDGGHHKNRDGQRGGDRHFEYGEREGHGDQGRFKGKKGKASRIAVSGASSQDVVTGTREALLEVFQKSKMRNDPAFALFSAGPCGAMIGTDLEEIAGVVSEEYQIPAAAVDLTGQKTYDVGISKTLEAMAKLLAQSSETKRGTINLLGATALDWADEDIAELKNWAAKQGFQVLAQPGGAVTCAQLKTMGNAQWNLAATVSGLAAARYLEAQFGTPYIAAAPFGEGRCKQIAQALTGGSLPEQTEQTEVDALVIGEQFTANAVRAALERKGIAKGANVATFFLLEKAYARPGDCKLQGEDSARKVLNDNKYRLIIADPLLRPLLQNTCQWIDLPHRAFHLYTKVDGIPLLGRKLDDWLEWAAD